MNLRWMIPYQPELTDNPAYQQVNVKSGDRFWLWTVFLLLRASLVVLLIYGALHLDDWLYDQRVYVSGSGVMFLFFISIVAMLYGDIAGVKSGMQTARDAITHQKTKIENLLMHPRERVETYHAVARLNVWRLTMTLVGFRLVVAVLVLLEFGEQLAVNAPLLFDLQTPLYSQPVLFLVITAALLVAIAVYITEPCWRMSTTTAYGLSAATRRTDEGLLLSGGFWWGVAAYWGLLYAVYVIALAFAQPRYTSMYYSSAVLSFAVINAVAALIALLLGLVVIYVYERWMIRRFLTETEQNIIDEGLLLERSDQIEQDKALAVRKRQYYNLLHRFFAWLPLFKTMKSHNPVFVMEARHLKHGGSIADLRGLTFRVVRRVVIITAILTGVLILVQYRSLAYNMANSPNFYSGIYYGQHVHNLLMSVAAFMAAALAGVSVVGSLFLDFSCIMSGMNSINRDMVTGRWDLLRVTMVPERQILIAKHTITQLLAWRALVWVVAMRVIPVLILVVLLFIPPSYAGSTSTFERLTRVFHTEPLMASVIAFGGFWFTLIYLLEPFWRHQTMTAVGLAVSAGRNTTSGILTGLGAILGVWISQGFVIGLLFWIMVQIGQLISGAFYQMTGDSYELQDRLWAIAIMIACFITGWVIFGYYSILQRFNLNNVRQRAFKA